MFGRRLGEAALPAAPPEAPGDVLRPARRARSAESQPQGAPPEKPPSEQDETGLLLAHVLSGSRGQVARRVLVTHVPAPEAPLGPLECAAFASHFARSLAFEGRAILVMLGAIGPQHPGLFELVEGSASFSEAIHRDAGTRLHVLPAGRGRTHAGPGLNVVIDALSETYDFVVMVTADEDIEVARRQALALASRADHVMLACAGQIGSPDMLALRDALREEGAGDVVAARIGLSGPQARAAA